MRGSVKLTKSVGVVLVLLTAGSWLASAQSWDTSGNGLLKGTYYFRDVYYTVSDEYSDLGRVRPTSYTARSVSTEMGTIPPM
jgi:hypothetical protein